MIYRLMIALGVVILAVSTLTPAMNPDRPHGLPWDRTIQPFRLSDGFWARRGEREHGAWDCPMPIGTPLMANFDAQIEFNWSPRAGRFVCLKNGNWEIRLMHMSKFETKDIKKGSVNYGDVIGYSGSSGESTGPHLHFEVLYRGIKINPQEIMN